jgi:AGCS family alanine or glycine:cation symporter
MVWLNALDGFMWGKYMMIALFFTGIVLTVRLRGVQFRKLGHALRLAFTGASLRGRTEGEGDITPFQALMTTLASTVGNGNIAGVATAIALGGPGAPLWMWITALIGMATRATEAMLGVKYRRKADDGTMIGGAFYYLEDGASEYVGRRLGKTLAVAFAFAGMMAAFGIGCMVQSNSVALSVTTLFNIKSRPPTLL